VVVTGAVISHAAHLLAVGLLFVICYTTLPTSRTIARRIAFTAAALHIISPAGLFLSAPYGESLYAALTFAGIWTHAAAFDIADGPVYSYGNATTRADAPFSLRSACLLLTSSLFFGLGSLIRGNGLLNGLVFLWDILPSIYYLPSMLQRRNIQGLLETASIGLAGALLGLIYASGQLEPYLRHCTQGNDRPWCSDFPPSIYTFVQRHYWNNGFLRYWTLSNLPLFLLAMPMLVVMLGSSYLALCRSEILIGFVQKQSNREIDHSHYVKPATGGAAAADDQLRGQEVRFKRILASLALPQLAFTLLAFTSFHVQIVNRVSSGYALWYIVLAIALQSSDDVSSTSNAVDPSGDSPNERKATPTRASEPQEGVPKTHDRAIQSFLAPRTARNLVRGMVMYAIIQGGLYSSFLPPA
jgi:phosphatidylinositol glycan class V